MTIGEAICKRVIALRRAEGRSLEFDCAHYAPICDGGEFGQCSATMPDSEVISGAEPIGGCPGFEPWAVPLIPAEPRCPPVPEPEREPDELTTGEYRPSGGNGDDLYYPEWEPAEEWEAGE